MNLYVYSLEYSFMNYGTYTIGVISNTSENALEIVKNYDKRSFEYSADEINLIAKVPVDTQFDDVMFAEGSILFANGYME